MGISNWKKVEYFFDKLNEADVKYVVLRNYEDMDKENFFCEGHEDIDILCEDVKHFVNTVNVICKMIPEDDIHFVTYINGKMVPIDLRHQGDDYYDEAWEKNILNKRKMASNGNWYVMKDEDYYFSLCYHAILQKQEVNSQYVDKLNGMAQKLGYSTLTVEDHLKNLSSFMHRNSYRYTQPLDRAVPFQWKYIDKQDRQPIKNKKISYPNVDDFFAVALPITKKLHIYSFLKKIYYNSIKNSFDTKRGRFIDIEKLSRKIERKYGEDVYDQLAQRKIYRYINRYIDEIADIKQHLQAQLLEKKRKDCDNCIFTMWWQGYDDMPMVVRACLASLNKIGKKVIVLTADNIHEYISLPDYIWEKYATGKIGRAHFLDIVRVAVLVTYGGVWIDSTVYIAENIPNYMTDSFFVFKQSSQLRECRSFANWWIAAPCGDEIMQEQLSYLFCYWKYENVAMDDYIFDVFIRKIIDSNTKYQNIIDEIPTRITEQTHLLMNRYNKEYNSIEWQLMKKISPVFKCTYEKKGLSSYNTYYCKLCNGELG